MPTNPCTPAKEWWSPRSPWQRRGSRGLEIRLTALYWSVNPLGQSDAAMKTEAQKVLQAMSPAQKLRAAERLYHSARQLKAAALRAEHPDWTDEAIRQAVRQIFMYARS